MLSYGCLRGRAGAAMLKLKVAAAAAAAGGGEGLGVGCRRGGGRVARLAPRGGPQGGPAAEAAALEAAALALQEGGLVALPTDTVYGVACLAGDSRALEALYRLKGRAERKPVAICLPDVPHLYRYCNVCVPDALLHDLLPGPVTLVLERSEALNKDLNPFTPLVGVRIPSHWFARELARVCASPLALTSANISDEGSTLTVTEFQELWPHLALVVDGGPAGDINSPECRLGSTVVDLSIPGRFRVIRPGCAFSQTVETLVAKYGLIHEPSGS